MPLQLEILLHPAARWGEDESLLVAAGAAALLLQYCLCGIGTPGSSGIMVLGRRQWPPLPLPPPCLVTPQKIDLSDSDSHSSSDSSADDDSDSCVIVEPVGNKQGKTSFVCLSGDVRHAMLDKVKANASKGNPNVLSCEIAKTMLHSVVARTRRTQLIELAVRQDATMEIPDGRGGTSICDLLLRAIPMSILLE